jgi:(S)-mandelate dehydrogenase
MLDWFRCLQEGRGSEYLKSMGRAINVDDFRRRAQRRLPTLVFDYLEGGAEDEYCLRRNVEVLRNLRFLPKRLRDVTRPSCSIELFGRTCSAPFLIGPTGLNGVFWPNGNIALARAAARASIPFVLSTPAQNSIEEVAEKAGGELWFQLYDINRKLSENLVEGALRSGYKALVLTVDVTVNGWRERDLRNKFAVPFHYSWKAIWDGLRHPSWLWQFLRQGMPVMANLVTKEESNAETAAALARRQMNSALSWKDLRDLRALWPHTLIVKGVLDSYDAIGCAKQG